MGEAADEAADEARRVVAAAGGAPSAVVVPAPASGPGSWAGAPSAALDDDGGLVVAYRVRTAESRGSATFVGLAPDGVHLTPVVRLDKERFGAESLERPALVRTETGRWRLYVSCATPGSKHWRIDVLEADQPEGLQHAEARTAFAGDARTGVKDPVVRRAAGGWQAWVCCHPLELADEEDRMVTRYATSEDGLAWRWGGVALRGRPGRWDARGARVTAVLPDGSATYDGRASKAENFSERTGTAVPAGAAGASGAAGAAGAAEAPGALVAWGDAPVSEIRYLDVVALTGPARGSASAPPAPTGRYRLYYEAPLPDGSHELRTQLVTPRGAGEQTR